jgi:excisionase family DNA binding protein
MVLKVGQVAERLSISVSKVYQMVENGTLAHHKIGGAVRISEEMLKEYLQGTERRRGSAPSWQKKTDPRPCRVKQAKQSDWF